MRIRPYRQWGIRRKSVVAAVVTTAIALTIGGVLVLLFLQRGVLSSAEVTARTLSRDLADQYAQADINPGRLPSSTTALRGATVQIIDPQLRVVASSDAEYESESIAETFPSGSETVVSQTTTLHSLADSDEVMSAVTVFSSGGQAYAVTVATQVGVQLDTVGTVGLYFLIAVPLLVVLVGWGTSLVVGRALGSVGEIRGQVDQINRAHLATRIDVPPTNDEMAALATTMNSMLDRLDEADRRQRQFVADASHELRSPIASVSAAVEVLNDEGAAALTDVVPMIESENERLGVLVENLLTLARADDHGAFLAPVLCDLDEVITSEIAIAKAKSPLSFVAEVEPVQTRCDPARMQQVVRNLIDNAARFAESTVTVLCRHDGENVVIDVVNDGPPIAESDRARVFERFVRLDASRSRAGGSAGLGLAIVQEICLAHGGTVEATASAAGECVFRVKIPVVE